MSLPVVNALVYTLVALALALVAALLVSAEVGWVVFTLGLLLQLGYHLRQWTLLEAWSRQPAPENELGGSGVWYEPFSRLYRHERELRQQIAHWQSELARFGAAGQALTFGIVATSQGERIEWLNRAAEQLLGLDQRADLGQPITHLIRQPAFVAYLEAGDFAQPLKLRSERAGERVVAVRVVDYGEGRRLIQITDVTQAERLDQTRRDFVANVSHELRTPLTVLSGFVETLQELELDAAERRRYQDLMAEQSLRMQRIVQDLLSLSTLESAPPPPETERIDVAALLDKLKRDAEALSGGRHAISLEIASGGDILGAEGEIASALGNLVSNAVRYTPEGGTIRLHWQSGPAGAEFAVVDSGIGIEAADIPRLTERFYRVDRGRSRETGGTGLGLAIVKHALGRHQATLEITSQLGQGSRFAARFPAARVVGL